MSDYTLESQGNKRFYQNSGTERLTELLHENGIDEKRFVKLREGTKQSYTDHTLPHNQHRPHDVEGNYGVLAGFGLLILDSDHYKKGEEIPDILFELLNKSPTYRVESPHGGEHYYYLVPEDAAESIEEVCGKHNPVLGAVEIKSKNSLVVGPGSELDGCTKDWCDNCTQEGEGRYQSDAKHGLNPLDFDRFIEVVDELTEKHEPDTSQYVSSPGEITLQTDAEEWVANAREWDPKLNQLMECLGDSTFRPNDYPEVEYPDRSRNEFSLAVKIMRRIGGFEDYERHTYRIMDQLNPPKWSKRGEDYRDTVLQSAKAYSTDIGEFYQIDQDATTTGQSRVLQHKVTEIILTIRLNMSDAFKTSEVAQWQDFSYDQTLRVLNDLAKAGYLQKKGETKGVEWTKLTEIPAFGPEYELIIQQYNDVEEDKQQRHEFLSQND